MPSAESRLWTGHRTLHAEEVFGAVERLPSVTLFESGSVTRAVAVGILRGSKSTDRTFGSPVLGMAPAGPSQKEGDERDEQEEHGRLEIPPEDGTDEETAHNAHYCGRESGTHHIGFCVSDGKI